jgi:hypothetical protein
MRLRYTTHSFARSLPCRSFLPNKSTKIAVILALLFLGFISPLKAQYYGEPYTALAGGLIGGINFSQVDGDGYKGYDKLNVTGGGIIYLPFRNMDLPIDGTIALSMEVLYTQKGSKGNTPVLGIKSQTINLHYGEIPIQVNYYRGARKSGFGLGLALGYLGFSEETIDGKANTDFPFHKFDLSFVLTGNIHVFKGIFVSPRFQYSMISIRDNEGGYGRSQQFNNLFALRLMYLIGSKSGY